MNEIATHPRRGDWIACIIMFPGLTAIGSIVPLLALFYFTTDASTGRVPWWGLAGSLIFGAGLAVWFVKRTINRLCWRLTESELIGGWSGAVRLPLSSIDKLVVGLPDKRTPWMDKLLSPPMRQAVAASKANSLLIKFQDGSMLPLVLHRMPNGDALMVELVARLQDRVVRDYTYSAQETRRLRLADPNALLRNA